VKEVYC
jgi:hypothetical protein